MKTDLLNLALGLLDVALGQKMTTKITTQITTECTHAVSLLHKITRRRHFSSLQWKADLLNFALRFLDVALGQERAPRLRRLAGGRPHQRVNHCGQFTRIGHIPGGGAATCAGGWPD